MTMMHVEVGRYHGTSVQSIARGLIAAGCMKDVWIVKDQHAFVPIEELTRELEAHGFYVSLIQTPEPPPLPLSARVKAWPRRVYYWGRRVVLRETVFEQWARMMHGSGDAIHDLTMRDSPMLGKIIRTPKAESSGEDD